MEVSSVEMNFIIRFTLDQNFTHCTERKVQIQDAAEWTPTFLKVTGKGVTGVGRRGRWQ
jgi:hypothetical protein